MAPRLFHLVLGYLVYLPLNTKGQLTTSCTFEDFSQRNSGQCQILHDETRILQLEKQVVLLYEKNQGLQKHIEGLETLLEKPSATGGAAYVRWGRTVCPENSTKLYSGYTGSSRHNHAGGTSDYLCLPKVPQFNYSGPVEGGRVWGTEYQVEERRNPFNTPNILNREMPCVLCQAGGRASQAMLPARLGCPTGWTKEYNGYMMAMYSTNLGIRSAICVDVSPEVVPGGHDHADQNLAYLLQTKCGSLACPPYQDKTLTCTVCTA